MKNILKIGASIMLVLSLFSCKEENNNEGSQSYKDNHPQDTTQTVKGDSARME